MIEYHCLHPSECKVKTPGKFCSGCRATARNKSPSTYEKAHSVDARAKRSKSVSNYRMGWCPPEYRDLNKKLRLDKVGLDERKEIIGSAIRQDAQKELQSHAAAAKARQLLDKAQRY